MKKMNIAKSLFKKGKSVFRKSLRVINQRLHKGDKVVCSVCHASFSIFAPFGLPQRRNARCWNCGSLERHRLFWKYIQEKTNFYDGRKKRVLHFAPEKMFYDRLSTLDAIEYIPCDLTPERYNFKGKAKVHQVDITRIPFEEGYFDVIICNHVLEHIPDDGLAMGELLRVLKKGGWGIFQVPLDYKRTATYEDFSITTPEGRQKAFGQHDHVRWYGQDYEQRLEKAGFKVLADDYIKSFSKNDVFKFGFNASELIYFCEKS